jgi:hypothetical protein
MASRRLATFLLQAAQRSAPAGANLLCVQTSTFQQALRQPSVQATTRAIVSSAAVHSRRNNLGDQYYISPPTNLGFLIVRPS